MNPDEPISIRMGARPDSPDGRSHSLHVFGIPLARYDDIDADRIAIQLGSARRCAEVEAERDAALSALADVKAAAENVMRWYEQERDDALSLRSEVERLTGQFRALQRMVDSASLSTKEDD